MTALAGLAVYNGALLVLGPAVLTRMTRSGHAPRTAVALWLTAIVSAVGITLLIATFLVVDVIAHWGEPGSLVASCVELLCDLASGAAGPIPQFAVLAVALAVVATTVVLAVRLVRTIIRLRDRAHDHGEAIRMVGQPLHGGDVYVVKSGERAAYCVAGRPSTIVVTSSAVAALGERELGAVLAHERAHLAGHHQSIVTVLRGLAAVAPRTRLLTRGAGEVARLLEMCADDAAVRRYGEHALLDGLLALVGAAPAHALGAADVAVLRRAQRLAEPATKGARLATQIMLAGVGTAIAVGPAAVLGLALSGFWPCLG